ncbi:hypothetical protein LCGC14_1413190 [marine sediment metagenome]|uniref:Uncharacterized protein n=1 Tax=marine sediment metagenome TaxID=412755 RepID=A0A0F9KEQ1_9ZZZZ
MIYGIIRGRTVVYKVEFIAGMKPKAKTKKACIVSNSFVGTSIQLIV